MTVLLLMLSVVMAWIEDRLSIQMMICDCCQFSLKYCAVILEPV